MDRFNSLYIEFLTFIEQNFPSYKKYIQIDQNKNYITDFIEYNLPFMEDISIRNADIFRFKYIDAQIIKGLKFKRIIDRVYDKKVSASSLESIWRLLHKLYIIAYNSCELKKLVKKNYSQNNDLMRILESHDLLVENIMISGYPIIDNKNEDEEESEEEEESNEEEDDDEKQWRKEFNQKFDKHGKPKSQSEQDQSEKDQKSDDNNGGLDFDKLGEMFDNSTIGNLAKDLSKEIDPKEFGEMKDFSDIGNIFGKLMQPDEKGENKLGNIMKSVTQKMDQKMKNGEIKQEQLINDAQNMMANMGQLFQGNNNPLAQMGSQMGMNMSNMGNLFQQMGAMGAMGAMGGKKKKNKKKVIRRKR